MIIDVDQPSMFNHFLLESSEEALRDLTSDKSIRNGSEVDVQLIINGKVIRVARFNDVLEDWSNRIREQVKTELEYLETEQAVFDKAEALIEQKIGKIEEVLNVVRMDTWRLYE